MQRKSGGVCVIVGVHVRCLPARDWYKIKAIVKSKKISQEPQWMVDGKSYSNLFTPPLMLEAPDQVYCPLLTVTGNCNTYSFPLLYSSPPAIHPPFQNLP